MSKKATYSVELTAEELDSISEVFAALEQQCPIMGKDKNFVSVREKILAGKNNVKINFSQVISGEATLNEEQQESFLGLFGKGCQTKTYLRLRSIIRYPSGAYNHSLYSRIIWKGNDCKYIAGQDYPAELTCVRELLKKDR